MLINYVFESGVSHNEATASSFVVHREERKTKSKQKPGKSWPRGTKAQMWKPQIGNKKSWIERTRGDFGRYLVSMPFVKNNFHRRQQTIMEMKSVDAEKGENTALGAKQLSLNFFRNKVDFFSRSRYFMITSNGVDNFVILWISNEEVIYSFTLKICHLQEFIKRWEDRMTCGKDKFLWRVRRIFTAEGDKLRPACLHTSVLTST